MAQSPADETGFQPNRDYLALQPFESLDTASGNLILTFTDLELPANGGRTLRFERVFNNHVVDPSYRLWRFSVAGLPISVIQRDIPPNAQIPDTIVGHQQVAPRFQMADGSEQSTTFVTEPHANNHSTIIWVSTPSFWRYNRDTRDLYLPDGTVGHYDDDGRLARYADAFNNTTVLSWPAANAPTPQLIVTQYLGPVGATQSRQVVIDWNSTTMLPTRMSYEDRVWTYEYDPGPDGLLRTVHVPGLNGVWQFDYQPPVNAAPLRLAHITTPQGGQISYSYDWKSFPFGPNPEDHEDAYMLIGRHAAGLNLETGDWQIDYMSFAGAPDGVVVTLPSGNQVTYGYAPTGGTLAGGWGLTLRTVTGNGATEQETRDYWQLPAVRANVGWYTTELHHRVITRSGRTYTTEYLYDTTNAANFANYHHPSQILENGELSRTTNLSYQHLTLFPYVLGLTTLETVTTANGTSSRSSTYDASTGFRASETQSGTTTTFAPDLQGNVAAVTNGNGHTTHFAYSWGQMSQTVTPEYGTSRDINPDGTVASENSGGRVTTYEYDLGRLKRTRPPGGTNPISIAYPNDTTITTTRGSSSTTTTLDGFGRAIRTENTAEVKTHIRYDAEGRKVYESYPFTGADLGITTSYDALGRVTQQQNPGGSQSTYTYGAGTVTVVDENGHSTTQQRSAFGHPDDNRLTAVTNAVGTWSYVYNVTGRLKTVNGPDAITRTWQYNGNNQLASETQPESLTVTYGPYDPAGNLQHKLDANGATFDYTYDGNERLKTITATSPGEQPRVTRITYEAGTDNRSGATIDGAIATTFQYDGAGRQSLRTDTVDGRQYTRFFQYDANDNPSLFTYASGRRIQFGYDGENRLTSVTDLTANRPVAYGFSYHPSGAVASFVSGNNITNAFTYDASRYWVRTINAGDLHLTYDNYDNVGNVGSIGDTRPSQPFGNQTFTYDALDRLHTAVGPWGSATYEYDAHGNRTNASGSTYDYFPGTLRLRQQNNLAFTYDNNGNLKTSNNDTFTYTPDNQLETSNVAGIAATYAYDADGWRAKRTTAEGRRISSAALTENWRPSRSIPTRRLRRCATTSTPARGCSPSSLPRGRPAACATSRCRPRVSTSATPPTAAQSPSLRHRAARGLPRRTTTGSRLRRRRTGVATASSPSISRAIRRLAAGPLT